MASQADLQIILQMRDQASREFVQASRTMTAAAKQLNAGLAAAGGRSNVTARALADIGRVSKQAAASLNSLGSTLQGMGTAMTVGVTLPILATGAAMVKMGMDAVESEDLFRISMGDMAAEARAWAKQLADALNLNSYAVRQNVATFNVMFGSMGIGQQAAFDMAKGLTQLSYDLSSFYNLSREDAFQKLQSGISGEVEPLKRLGIVMNETNVEQWALNKGLVAQGQAMSDAQKVVARYGYLLDAASKAQGNLAETIDSPMNKLRGIQDQFSELATEIGMEFLPAISTALTWVSDYGVPAVKEGVSSLKDTWTEMSDHAKAKVLVVAGLLIFGGPLLTAIGTAIRGVGMLISAFAMLPPAVQVAVAGAAAGFLVFSNAISDWLYKQAAVNMSPWGGQAGNKIGAQLKEWADAIRGATSLENLAKTAGSALYDNAFQPMIDQLASQLETLTGDWEDKITAIGDKAKGVSGGKTPKPEIPALPADIKSMWEQAAAAAPSLANASGEAQKLRDQLVNAAGGASQLVAYLVSINPAVQASEARIAGLTAQIEELRAAQSANERATRAAQQALQAMQDRVTKLSDALSEAKQRLSDLGNVRLPGMGAAQAQIDALQRHIGRLKLADLTGKSIDEIKSQFPILAAGMEQWLASLEGTDSLDAMQRLLEILTQTKDLQFGEQMQMIQDAINGAPTEMPFAQALAAIASTKAEIAGLEGQLAGAEAAVKAQELAIRALNDASYIIGAQLDILQTQLDDEKKKHDAVTKALQDGYTWFIQDREKLAELGGEAVAQAGLIDTATKAMIGAISGLVDTEAAEAQRMADAAVAAWEEARRKITGIQATLPPPPTTGGGEGNGGGIQSYGSGGIVPGPIGSPRLAIVHGGERVIPVGGGGGISITMHIGTVNNVDDLESAVVAAVTRATRRGRM